MVRDWFQKCDTNYDGRLSFEEAKPYVKNWILGELGEDAGERMVQDIFQEIDANGDGFISGQELFKHIKEAMERRTR